VGGEEGGEGFVGMETMLGPAAKGFPEGYDMPGIPKPMNGDINGI
jgi:hypothetical protein